MKLLDYLAPNAAANRQAQEREAQQHQATMQAYNEIQGVSPALQKIAQMQLPDRERSFDQESRFGKVGTEEDYQRLFNPRFRQQAQPQDLQGIAQQAPMSPRMIRAHKMLRSGDPQLHAMGMSELEAVQADQRAQQAAAAGRDQEVADRAEKRAYDERIALENRGDNMADWEHKERVKNAGKAAPAAVDPWEFKTVDGVEVRYNKLTGETQKIDLPQEVQAERAAALKAGDTAIRDAFNSDYERMTPIIDKAISQVSGGTTGPFSVKMMDSGSPFSEDTRSLRNSLEVIKSNMAIEVMAEMKAQSATGASGMGALSERELDLLQTKIANLKQDSSPEELKAQLAEIKKYYTKLKASSNNAYNDKYGEKVEPFYKFNATTGMIAPNTEIAKGVTYLGAK